jgi:hypothetical protein
MRLLKEFLITTEQPLVVLENGPPCPHCHSRKKVAVSDRLIRWTVPNGLVMYAGDDVLVVCLDCLDEKRSK